MVCVVHQEFPQGAVNVGLVAEGGCSLFALIAWIPLLGMTPKVVIKGKRALPKYDV